MTSMIHDLQTALKRLIRTPLFTLAAVSIVTIGVGATTAAYTLVNAFLLRPMGYENPERLVHVYQDSDDGDPSSTSFPAYRDMSEFADVFSGVAAYSTSTVTWEQPDGPLQALAEFTTASLFPVLGLRPSRGRWFDASLDQVGAGAFAVVSYRTWLNKMNADPDVVGRSVQLNGHRVTVLGVGPASYNGSGGAVVTDFWLSLSSTPIEGSYRVSNLDRREDHWYDVMARLAPGVFRGQAQAAMDLLAERLAKEYPELNQNRDITVFGTDQVRLHPDVDAQLVPAAGLLLIVVSLVLLLACSNLANLLLVRGVWRAPEVAIRRALGASGPRVAVLFLWEALLIAAVGGVIAMFLARAAVSGVSRLPLPLPVPGDLDLTADYRVILFNVGLVLVTATLFGLGPALRVARREVAGALHADGRIKTPGRRASFFRHALVAVQVAVSLVLLVGAALFGRSLANAYAVDPGVDADKVAYLRTSLGRSGLSGAEIGVAVDELGERFAALPGVTEVAYASRLPVHNRGGSTTTVVEGYEPPTGTGSVELYFSVVSGSYYRTLGIRVLAGRSFGREERIDGVTAVVVNETAARRFWGGAEEAVGKRLRPQSSADDWRQVVGVVSDSKVRSLTESATPLLYFSAEQNPLSSPYFLVRGDRDPAMLARALQTELRSDNANLPIDALGTLAAHVGDALDAPRALAVLLANFSLIAIVLATLGVHAVVAFSVARRTPELGLRIAVGASRGRIVGMVVREVLLTVGAGLLLGLGLAAALGRLVEGVLYQVAGLDPGSYAVAAGLLLLGAVVASYLPARRAAAADPVAALRAQ